jgi:uncharacterized LabA/DUF88 family protein
MFMRSEIVAILVDGGFFQRRAKTLWGEKSGEERARELMDYCHRHLRHQVNHETQYDDLYRIFYYDCPPADCNVYHPLHKKDINLKKTDLFAYMTAFHESMRHQRKVALRMGKLSANDLNYSLNLKAQKKLIRGEMQVSELTDEDFTLNIGQKGVDMRIGIDIASMAFKRQVTRIILISGDSDFVPAAKLARREGIDFVLDPMGASISPDLSEHIDGITTQIKSMPKKETAASSATLNQTDGD